MFVCGGLHVSTLLLIGLLTHWGCRSFSPHRFILLSPWKFKVREGRPMMGHGVRERVCVFPLGPWFSSVDSRLFWHVSIFPGVYLSLNPCEFAPFIRILKKCYSCIFYCLECLLCILLNIMIIIIHCLLSCWIICCSVPVSPKGSLMFPHSLLDTFLTNNNESTCWTPTPLCIDGFWILKNKNFKSSAWQHIDDMNYSCIYCTDKTTERKTYLYHL